MVVVSLIIFQAVNSVTEIITVGGSPSQTLIDSSDYILGVKSILFSRLSCCASGLEEQTAGLAIFCACVEIWLQLQAWRRQLDSLFAYLCNLAGVKDSPHMTLPFL